MCILMKDNKVFSSNTFWFGETGLDNKFVLYSVTNSCLKEVETPEVSTFSFVRSFKQQLHIHLKHISALI